MSSYIGPVMDSISVQGEPHQPLSENVDFKPLYHNTIFLMVLAGHRISHLPYKM